MDSPETRGTKIRWNSRDIVLGRSQIWYASCFHGTVEKLVTYLPGPDCGEDAVGHILDEDVGISVPGLASGERVDAMLSSPGPAVIARKENIEIFAVDGNGCCGGDISYCCSRKCSRRLLLVADDDDGHALVV